MTRRPLERPGRRIVRPSEAYEPTEAEQLRALAEVAKRAKARKTVDFRALCHPKQRGFVEDTNPLVAACCSRRSGKSWGFVLKMLATAQHFPWATIPYVTLTRQQGKRNVWQVIHRFDDELQLGGKFNHTELSYRLPNGCQLQLFGANDEAEIERLRGTAYPLVVIDEAQAFRSFLKALIEEVIEPATLDYQGQILMGGTPNAACWGFFHDVSKGIEKGWSLHHWTLLDNPHLPHAKAWLRQMMERRGWTPQTPKLRREYYGEWVRDEQSQVYRVTPTNVIAAFPESWADDWEYVLGVDLGFVNVTAFVVMAFSVKLGKAIAVESYQIRPSHFGADVTLLTPDLLASEISKLRARYDFLDIVIDPGSLGAVFIDDIRRRFRIPAKAAEKKAKMGAIEVLNGDLQAGHVLLVEGSNIDLIEDARLLERNLDRVNEKRHGGAVNRADLLISDKHPDHLCDAMLYAHRACRAYLHEPASNDGIPRLGTPEYLAWKEAEHDRRIIEASLERDDRAWYDRDPADSDFRESFNIPGMGNW